MNKIIIICGATCSGKTNFSIKITSYFNGEIINADSMQIYRYMNIGTAKPTMKEQTATIHHMIDIVDPNEYFDAFKYSKLAKNAIKNILNKGKTPIIVGGTGLYIKALIEGLFTYPSKNLKIRKQLYEKAKILGGKQLHYNLSKIDKISAEKIHHNDLFRIIRALEVFKSTGIPISSIKKKNKKIKSLYNFLNIGLLWPRSELYHRINKRVDNMIYQGLIEEVKSLLGKGFSPQLKAMQSLGYRHIIDFLDKSNYLNKTLKNLKQDHRKYAKRQLTWLKINPSIHWFPLKKTHQAVALIKKFLQK